MVTQKFDHFSFLIAVCCNLFKWCTPRQKCPFFSLFCFFFSCSLHGLFCGFLFSISPLIFLCCFKRDLLKTHAVTLGQEDMCQRLKLLRQKEKLKSGKVMRNAEIKKEDHREGEKLSTKSVGVGLNVMLHAHQEIGVERVAPCLNPTDQSPSLTTDGNQ